MGDIGEGHFVVIITMSNNVEKSGKEKIHKEMRAGLQHVSDGDKYTSRNSSE